VVSADVRVTGEGISPIHAVLEVRKNQAGADNSEGAAGFIFDLASLSGVFVNGKKVLAQALQSQDKITIGRYHFKYSIEILEEGAAKKRDRSGTRETEGRLLFIDPKEDLQPLLLQDDREIEEIFDFRPTSKLALEVVMSWYGSILAVEHFVNEKRNQGSKWTKLKSFKRFLTKNGFIKYDFERDLYFNCHKIKRLEEIRLETDRRKAEAEAQQAEDERLRLERLEADRVQREAQQSIAKPPQAHRETQPQQGTQAEPSELERLKDLRARRLRFLDSIRKEVLDHPEQSHAWEPIIEKGKLFIADLEIKISELEKCEAKLSV
jgi:pSer/pThr/pTyr-binding forkhead associated (FHA) protein